MIKKYILIFMCIMPMWAAAQVGEHRNQFTVGIQGGCNLNTVSFLPKVNQKMAVGTTGGMTVRYTSEKYFKTICSVQMEFNYSQLGWEEEILDGNDNPVHVLNGTDNEHFKRTINYFQIPVLAHLAWGKEKSGVNFFFEAGPQIGFLLSDKLDKNFDATNLNYTDRGLNEEKDKGRYEQLYEKLEAPFDNNFDYGIAAGGGIEVHVKPIGRFQLTGRYYYGLGNLFNDSKKDYFSRSPHQTITVRAAYLIDL